jgi:site-specific DNA-cytosine methylase
MGGKHKGQLDARNMFPEMLTAIRAMRPKAILIENVKGLLRQSRQLFPVHNPLTGVDPEGRR